MKSSKFKVIGIFGRVKNPGVKETLHALFAFLIKLQQKFIVDEESAALFTDLNLDTISREKLGSACDLLIVVGGDGSMLHAAHTIANADIPVIGINRGRLGFLTDILPNELHRIEAILTGQFQVEKRFLLTASVHHQDEVLGSSVALNEVALIPDSVPHMIEFEIDINKQFVCSQDSDGLIIATPTGSTAYALSGGGPILHPQLDALVIVPMFPHTLSMRPIVIDGNSEITIRISPFTHATPRITCDGQAAINAPAGSQIFVKKKASFLHLIHPNDYDYYATLRSKLHWGRKLNYSE